MIAIRLCSFGRQTAGREQWSLTYGPGKAAAESPCMVQSVRLLSTRHVTARVSGAGMGTGVSALEIRGGPYYPLMK